MAIIVSDFKRRVQFRVNDTILSLVFALTIGTYILRTRLKRGRQVTSSRYYSCSMPNNRFLSRFSQYVSISLAFQCLTDGRPFCSASSLFPSFSPVSSVLSSARVPVFLSQNFHLFQFLSRSRTLQLSFILLFSRGYRKLSTSFANYFPPTLLISSFVYTFVCSVCFVGKRIELYKRVIVVKMKKSFLV